MLKEHLSFVIKLFENSKDVKNHMMSVTAVRSLTTCLFLLLLAFAPATVTASLAAQREDFLKAESAIKSNDIQKLVELKQRLANYPLLPYIEFQDLTGRLRHLHGGEAEAFLTSYQGTPIADRFRRIYLNHLGKSGNWREYLRIYQPTDNAERRCYWIQALMHTGKKALTLAEVEPLWLNAKSMPDTCDPVFNAAREVGLLTRSLLWKRINLSMQAGNLRLAKYLARSLPDQERSWFDLWLQVDNQPGKIDESGKFATNHSMRNTILLYGLKRLAREDPEKTAGVWKRLSGEYLFTSEERYQAEQALALGWIRSDHPDALAKLDQFTPAKGDHLLHEKRIRAALSRKARREALAWIEALPSELHAKENWRYWRARALLETGATNEANRLFKSLSKERSYHGFLAADRVGRDYNLNHRPLTVAPEQIEQLATRDGFRRAQELFTLGRLSEARSEWYAATKNLGEAQLQAAAKLAQGWNWHSQAIFTLARARYWDDLELRFPLEHEAYVEAASSSTNLDKAWVLAIIRQESAFSSDAESHAGALGLMQLMPATARGTAKNMQRKPPQRQDLLTPATNIEIGTSYLKKVFERLNDNTVLAISAYNAGPHRVLRWLPDEALDADLWIETIPFNETRRYTERVLAYSVIYDERLGQKVTQLRKRMPKILPDQRQKS